VFLVSCNHRCLALSFVLYFFLSFFFYFLSFVGFVCFVSSVLFSYFFICLLISCLFC
jgi:hypothetical protein